MRKYANHPRPGVVLIHCPSCPSGAVGPKYNSVGSVVDASFSSNIDRSAALSWSVCTSLLVCASYAVTLQNSLSGTGCGTVSL